MKNSILIVTLAAGIFSARGQQTQPVPATVPAASVYHREVRYKIKAIVERVAEGRKLANELGQELSLVLLGSKIGDLAQEAITFGADKVYVGDSAAMEQYNSDAYTAVVANLCRRLTPDIVLLGQTDAGRDMAPRLAGRLQGALSTDCLSLAIDKESKLLRATRPVFGGNALAGLGSTSLAEKMEDHLADIRKNTGRMADAAEEVDDEGGGIALG